MYVCMYVCMYVYVNVPGPDVCKQKFLCGDLKYFWDSVIHFVHSG